MRLITRGDLDGLTCAVLLTTMQDINEIVFAHPKDVQDGDVDIREGDIIANLPYHPGCSLWFDHHISEAEKAEKMEFEGNFGPAPSAARLVYEYYDSSKLRKYSELVSETDRMDSANLTPDDVTNPQRYVALLYTLDPRTGYGVFREYFHKLVELIKDKPVNEILKDPEVAERVERMQADVAAYAELVQKHSRLNGNVIIIDLRGIKNRPTGNRFLEYTLYPMANVSVRIFDGKNDEFIVCAVGHSIFNRTCTADVGNLLAEYGGGGHTRVGSCQLTHDVADKKIKEIIDRLKGT
ncbi:MAG: exopolyphosphatase [Planctomycetota bacterium]|jgi:oligoribonuclease NrnB/cAMP/cGMP phosphodiesterase (DHH superfamily)